jgi:hypothetical protein
MARKDVERAKLLLKENPLYFTAKGTDAMTEHHKARLASIEGYEHKPCLCMKCGGNGKKVPLYGVFNFGNELNHCYQCGFRYTR